MLDDYVDEKIYAAAQRENIDLNNPEMFKKLTYKRQLIIGQVKHIIDQMTLECGCSKKSTTGPKLETL